jgi:uncharacterized protein (DUF433 family)
VKQIRRKIMASRTGYPHIEINQDGIAVIEGTGTKVIELVEEKRAYSVSPEELHLWHPYLSLAQIHAAFTYYWDHKDELDKQIERSEHELKQWIQHREEEHRAFEAKIRAKASAGNYPGKLNLKRPPTGRFLSGENLDDFQARVAERRHAQDSPLLTDEILDRAKREGRP